MNVKKHQVILILIITSMMMSSAFVGTASVNMKTIDMNNCSTDQMELPIWSHENFWIYDMNFEFEFENIFSAEGSIEDLKMVVVGINQSAEEYIIDITGYLHAQLKIFGMGIGSELPISTFQTWL